VHPLGELAAGQRALKLEYGLAQRQRQPEQEPALAG